MEAAAWALVIWAKIMQGGAGSETYTRYAEMPDMETCLSALAEIQVDFTVPTHSDKRRTHSGFVAHCEPYQPQHAE